MNVRMIEEPGCREIEVTVRSAPGDSRAARIAERVRSMFGRLVGYADGGSIDRLVVSLESVISIETAEKRAWINTVGGKRLESPMRLYELEDALEGTEFVRVSRQTLVNLDHVMGIRPEPNGRLALKMGNEDIVIVSRSYVSDLKGKIGITH